MKSILDPSFRYSSSVHTDLKKTFAKVRREQRRTEQPAAKPMHGTSSPTVFRLQVRKSSEG